MDLMRRRLLMAGNGLKDYTIFGKSEVVGSSVLGVGDVKNWCQLCNNMLSYENFEGATTYYDTATNEVVIVNVSRTSKYSSGSTRRRFNFSVQQGHKYLFSVVSKDATGITLASINSSTLIDTFLNNVIKEATSDRNVVLRITSQYDWVTAHPVGDEYRFQMNFFDLTAIFGSGNEPTSVEDFKSWLVSVGKMKSADGEIPYFPYDAGSTFASLPIVALKGYGKVKLKDLTWQYYGNSSNWLFYANVVGGRRQVGYNNPVGYICIGYEGNGYTAGGTQVLALPSGSCRWDATNSQILVKDTNYTTAASFKAHFTDDDVLYYESTDATEHSATTFPLAISAPLHGVGTADFAKFTDKGITRKFGVVDLGTLAWAKTTSSNYNRFYAKPLPLIKAGTLNMISSDGTQPVSSTATLEGISVTSNSLVYYKRAEYTDLTADEFKTAMSGVYLVYELAEETFESVKLPKLPKFKDGTLVYTDTEIHGNITTE